MQLYDRLKKATFYDGKQTWVEERPEEEGFQMENREFIAALNEGSRSRRWPPSMDCKPPA